MPSLSSKSFRGDFYPAEPISPRQLQAYNYDKASYSMNLCLPVKQAPQQLSSLFPFGYPRSMAEAKRLNDAGKYRQLPCRTFISVGTCPYRDRCDYLHDPRLASSSQERVKATRKKNKEDIVYDSLFWPIMPLPLVSRQMDSSGRKPSVFQEYNVPFPQRDVYCRHDQCVYSLYMHFVLVCMSLLNDPRIAGVRPGGYASMDSSESRNNQFTGRPRLSVFLRLSQGRSIAVSSAHANRAKGPPSVVASRTQPRSPRAMTAIEVMTTHNRVHFKPASPVAPQSAAFKLWSSPVITQIPQRTTTVATHAFEEFSKWNNKSSNVNLNGGSINGSNSGSGYSSLDCADSLQLKTPSVLACPSAQNTNGSHDYSKQRSPNSVADLFTQQDLSDQCESPLDSYRSGSHTPLHHSPSADSTGTPPSLSEAVMHAQFGTNALHPPDQKSAYGHSNGNSSISNNSNPAFIASRSLWSQSALVDFDFLYGEFSEEDDRSYADTYVRKAQSMQMNSEMRRR